MNNGTDLSFLKGFAPQQGNWTGNTVNISGLPSAHIGTDPLPVPFWGNVKPAARTPAQLNGAGGGGGGSVSPGMGGGDIFDILSQLHPTGGKTAPTQNTVQMPTIGGYTLTADDLAALQTLPDILWPQTPQRSVTPTVTAQEGDQIPNNAPVYDGQPVSFHPMQGASPAVSTMEGDQIPNNAPVYDSAAYGVSPYQVQAPNITPDIGDLSQWGQMPFLNGDTAMSPNQVTGWGGLTQADINALMKTPQLPQEGPGTAFNVGMNALGLVPGWGTLANALGGFGVGLAGDHLTQPNNSGNGVISWLQNRVESPGLAASGANWLGRQIGSIFDAPDPNSAPPTPAQNGASGGGDIGGISPWDITNTGYQNTLDTAFPNFMAGAGWGGAGFGYGGMGGYAVPTPDNNGGWGQ